MIKVGNLVVGDSASYHYTTEEALCIVTNINKNSMRVGIIAHADKYKLDNKSFEVHKSDFKLMTIEEYFSKYPNAYKCKDFDSIIKNYVPNEDPKNNFVLTDSEKKSLIEETKTLLEQYHYPVTEYGITKMLNEWANNKGDLISLIKNHPNYNGKYQIAFDTDYNRTFDVQMVNCFKDYISDVYAKLSEIKYYCLSYYEAENLKDHLRDILVYMGRIIDLDGRHSYVTVNDQNIEYYKKQYQKFKMIVDKFDSDYRSTGHVYYTLIDGNRILICNRRNLDGLKYIISYIIDEKNQFLTESIAEYINEVFPSIKAVKGQKVSRVVNKICHLLEIDKDKNYNREFAKFSDAINPLNIVRHTVISCHPIDYLTMSFGNSWASCHTIDKQNQRNIDSEHNYHGGYSGGTLSYMLDSTSMVFYTVDNKYDENELELQPKINRNMFHFGNDKLVQGRVYPQSNDDDDDGIYAQIRAIVQKVMADCLGADNLWVLKKGTSECRHVIVSRGEHYKDYLSYDTCNVSYLKKDGEINDESIIVGHRGICPRCGEVHTNDENILCGSCESVYNNQL